MIITDLWSEAQGNTKTIHELIDESLDTYPEIEVRNSWRQYTRGEMKDHITVPKRMAIGSMSVKSPTQNMLRQCLRQIVGRIRFKRFVVSDAATQKWLDEYAIKNVMTRKSVGVARQKMIDGNTALSQVWRGGIDGMAIVRQEYWRDEYGYGIFVGVDETGNARWAVNDYVDNDDVNFRVLYLPDRIITYRHGSEADGWVLLEEFPWVKKDGTPIGMPVSHFPNADPDYGPYGTSTIAEVLPVQDSLNLSLFNRMAVGALTGQMIYWGTGVKKNANGDEIGPGTMLTSEDPASRFGHIPPGSIEGLMQDTDDWRNIISGAFPVPAYRLGSGDWPSGLALQRSDGPMITSVRLSRDIITPGLVHHAHRATVMANVFGGLDLDTESLITVDWEPIDELDPGTEAEIQQARIDALLAAEDLTEVGLKKTGMFTPAEIAAIIKAREAEEEKMIAQVSEEDM